MRGESGSGDGTSTTAPQSHGAAFVPPRPEDLAPFFPQLEILELLGQGGMGVVYKARQLRLDRLVALKILPPELGRDPAFAERFAREARVLARLSHPRIVGVHDFGEAGGLFYLVMEFVDGVNLRGLLRRGRLEPEEALRIVPQICEALQYAHEERVVHRDIKPENILLDRRGNVKIADFGLAKLLGMLSADSVLTGSRQVMGTLRYMAPEQFETPLAVDHRADIYSLGVVFYEMLTGGLPVGRFDPPSKKAGVDARLDEIVLRALENERDRRYQNASDVKAELEALSFHPARSGTASGMSSDEAGGRPAMTRLEAWLLFPILCVTVTAGLVKFIASLARPVSELGPGVPFILMLTACAGLWGIWRSARGGRSEESIRPDRAGRRTLGTAWAWPWLFLIGGFYGLSLIIRTGLSSGRLCPDYELFFGDMAASPHWLANPSLWIGCRALMARRWLGASLAGTIATLLALWPMEEGAEWASTSHAGYNFWLASMVLLAVGGFHGWWRTRREARPGDVKTALPEIEPPWSDLNPSSGSPETRPGVSHGGGGGHSVMRRQEAWLLILLFCAMMIASAYHGNSMPPLFRTWLFSTAVGVGLWALWRFARGVVTREIKSVVPGVAPPESDPTRDFGGH